MGSGVHAQSPAQLLNELVIKFNQIKNYEADVMMQFDIPFMRIEDLLGKVYFKQPDKFRVKTEGIAFLPKQNPYYALSAIVDSNKYTAVESGKEIVDAINTRVINVLPQNHPELILAKFWIDPTRKLILKSQLTTKTNGTVQVEYQYGSFAKFTLPDKMTFTVETGKFKMPKAMAIELNSKKRESTSQKPRETGIIKLQFSNYILNQKMDEKVFSENE
jgi:outer membrane lipoprotein-sorting protein